MIKRATPLLLGVVSALVLHVLLGWYLASLGAVLTGYLSPRRSLWKGVLVMAISWGLLVAFNFMFAFRETAEMTRVTAALLGGLPAPVPIVATMVMAIVLGMLAGWLGGALKRPN